MARSIDTGTDDLLAHIDGHLGVITFRPERRNALSDPMYAGFDRALLVMAPDPDVRVLVVTGAGGDVKGRGAARRAVRRGGARLVPHPCGRRPDRAAIDEAEPEPCARHRSRNRTRRRSIEAPNMVESMSTADHREAAAAFVEKRRPVFTGR